jgi:histone H1/5
MADAVVSTPASALSAAKVAKKPRKAGTGKPKKPSDHPKYSQMIKEALVALKERGGSSRQAILKYLLKHYRLGGDEKTVNAHLKLALRAGTKNGTLKQSKGTGASGSFRIGEKKTAEKKSKVKKAKKAAKPKKAGSPKKPKAKKAKAAGAKKAAKPKTAKPKKAKAAAKPKSPKKVKVAKPKKAKSPKAKKPKVAKPKKAAAKK